MTTSEEAGPAPPPRHSRARQVLSRKQLTVRRAAWIIASVTVSVTTVAGIVIHFTDRKTFPNIGDSLWWAIQTVTTVGYGDLVPTSLTGRLVAALIMLIGISFVTVITATITSAFVDSARRRTDATTTDPIAVKLDQISARLEVIEAGLRRMSDQDIEDRFDDRP